MKSFVRLAVGAVLLAMTPMAAFAQSAAAPATAPEPGKGAPLAVCRADIDQLCPGAAKGDRRKCLTDNAAKLSPACTSAIADLQGKIKAMREACAVDVKSLCADTAKGGGAIVQCLRGNAAKLSPGCDTAIKARFPKG